MLELLIFISKILLIPVLFILPYYGLRFFVIYMTIKHPEMSDEKIKYLTQMVSKDKLHFNKK